MKAQCYITGALPLPLLIRKIMSVLHITFPFSGKKNKQTKKIYKTTLTQSLAKWRNMITLTQSHHVGHVMMM
jgi:hypothetical protein